MEFDPYTFLRRSKKDQCTFHKFQFGLVVQVKNKHILSVWSSFPIHEQNSLPLKFLSSEIPFKFLISKVLSQVFSFNLYETDV